MTDDAKPTLAEAEETVRVCARELQAAQERRRCLLLSASPDAAEESALARAREESASIRLIRAERAYVAALTDEATDGKERTNCT